MDGERAAGQDGCLSERTQAVSYLDGATGGETPDELRRRIAAEPLPPNLGDHLDAAVGLYGDQPAWIWIETEAEDLTYSQVGQLTARSANAFAALGITKGMHVGVAIPGVPEFLAAWLALGKLGAVLVPMNSRLTSHEMEHVLDDGGIDLLLASEEALATIRPTAVGRRLAHADRIVVFGDRADDGESHNWSEKLAQASATFTPRSSVDLDDVSSILYTSGSTGKPKGCILTHRYWLTLGMVKSAITSPAKRILAELPFYYMSPYYRFSTATFRGAAICVPPAPSLSRFFERIRKYNLELVWANEPVALLPPSPFEQGKGNSLKHVSLYGLKKVLHAGLEERMGVPAREDFGMSEIGAGLYMPVEASHMTGSGSCGVPAPQRRAMIADENGDPVPAGETGELLICGPGIFKGYHNNTEATAKAFFGEWFRTGDLARQDDAGYYYIVGRMKEMIRRSAENIAAQEVEAVLYTLPRLSEAAVIGVPDEMRGEEVKACLVLQAGLCPDDLPPEVIIQHCRQTLSKFKVPRYIQYYSELPKTVSQKIAKKVLETGGGVARSKIYDAVAGTWIETEADGIRAERREG